MENEANVAAAEAVGEGGLLVSTSFWFWTGLALVCLVASLTVTSMILHRSAGRPHKNRLGAVLKGLWPVVLSLIAVVIASLLFLKAAGNVPPTDQFSTTLSLGFVASLFEDILFFTFLGFVVLFVQQTEFFRSRKLDERIDYLFNAKRLTSEELTYLKEKVSEIACDFRSDETTIDVKEHDEALKMVRIDVTRRFRVGNYLRERASIYDWKMEIEPDPMPDKRDSMTIYPPVTTLYQERADHTLTVVADAEEIGPLKTISAVGETYELRDKRFPIAPQQVRECRSRFEGWQRLFHPNNQPDSFEILVERHWDRMSIRVVNSLMQPLVVHFREIRRKVRLAPGDHLSEAWLGENVESGRKISIEFSPVAA